MNRADINKQLIDIEQNQQQICSKQEQIKCLEGLLQSHRQELETLTLRLYHLNSNYHFCYQSMLAYESKISKINITDLPTDVLAIILSQLSSADRAAFACCKKMARVRFSQVRTICIINTDYAKYGHHHLTNCVNLVNTVQKWNTPTYISKMGVYVTKYAPKIVFTTKIFNIKQLLTLTRLARIRVQFAKDEISTLLEYTSRVFKTPHPGFVELFVPTGTLLPKNSDKKWNAIIKYY